MRSDIPEPLHTDAELLGQIGKYRIRKVRVSKDHEFLDIREYVIGNYEGYTRKGIKLQFPDDVKELLRILDPLR